MKALLQFLTQITVAAILVAVFLIPTPAAAQSPHDLYQKALRLENSVGDLEGAIELYEQVVEKSDADRALVARALLRLGRAYEMLGKIEAFAVYERVVVDFQDFEDEVSEARSRMRGLAQNGTESTEKMLVELDPALSTYGAWAGTFSGDGKYFVNTDWESVRIGYQEVGKNGLTYITPEQSDSLRSTPQDATFSPDGQFIAYDWIDANSSYQSSIRVFDIKNGTTRTILTGPYSEFYGSVLNWSSDGNSILVLLKNSGDLDRLALIDAESGDIRRSAEVEDGFSYAGCILQNRYVLFEQSSLTGSDVQVLDLDSGQVDAFLPGSANRSLLGCSNKKQIALVRTDMFGKDQVWMYGLSDGRAVGDPVYLRDIEPEVTRININGDGDFLYFRGYNLEITTALYPYSAREGVITGRGESLPKAHVRWAGPGWTRDGNKLAYRIGSTKMWVREQDGTTRIVELSKLVNRYKWSADGSKFIAAGVGSSGSGVTYRLDIETGAVIDSTLNFFGTPGLSGDAMFGVDRKDATTACVYEVPSGSNVRREYSCYRDEGSNPVEGTVLLSPDNRRLIVATRDGQFTLIDLETDVVRPLADDPSYAEFSKVSGVSWLPDASGVLGRQHGTLVRLSLAGGPPVPELVHFSQVNWIVWTAPHPSGDQIVVNSSYKSPDDDYEKPKDLHVIINAVDRLRD